MVPAVAKHRERVKNADRLARRENRVCRRKTVDLIVSRLRQLPEVAAAMVAALLSRPIPLAEIALVPDRVATRRHCIADNPQPGRGGVELVARPVGLMPNRFGFAFFRLLVLSVGARAPIVSDPVKQLRRHTCQRQPTALRKTILPLAGVVERPGTNNLRASRKKIQPRVNVRQALADLDVCRLAEIQMQAPARRLHNRVCRFK